MTRYFSKEIVGNKLWLKATGAPVPWEPTGDGNGVFATDDISIANELDIAVSKGIGGVGIIDQATYDDAKKKASEPKSPLNSIRDRFSLSGLNLPVPSNLAALAVGGNPAPLHGQLVDVPKQIPEPIKVPTEFVRPKIGKFLSKQSGGTDAPK